MKTAATVALCALALVGAPAARAIPSEPGVVQYAVLGRGSVGNIVGATMGWEWVFTDPVQDFSVDVPVCNNWADIGLPEVFDDPDLASFNGAVTQESATDATHLVKQAVGVFATTEAADRAFRRLVDRTMGCAGQTATMRFGSGAAQTWSFEAGVTEPTNAFWVKQEVGTDRRCFTQTRKRENVLLQAKVCQSGNGGLAVDVLAGAMQNTLGQ
ncbi:MAG: sensor domain-containing protein [Mycobacterium sp.]